MKKGLILNLTSNISQFTISIMLSLLLVPFMIKRLGIEAYGFVPLTQQLINYLTVITFALNSMIARCFTVAVKSGENDLAEEYFNTSLFSNTILSILLLFPIGLTALFINRIINVPASLLQDVRITILLFGSVFVLSTVATSFNVAVYCTNRLYINSFAGIVNNLLRTFCIVMFFVFLRPYIWFISASTFAGYLAAFTAGVFFFKKLMPQIRFSLRYFDIKKLKEMLSSGLWVSFNLLGTLLYSQIDLLIANWTLGLRTAGEYSAVLQWTTMLKTFSNTISVLFAPTITSLYAQGDINGMASYANRSVKYTGLFLALPIGFICGTGGSLMTVWVGPELAKYHWLMIILNLHLVINLSMQTLFPIEIAFKKVKLPAVATFIMGAVNFLLAYMLAGPAGFGAYGIAIAGAFAITSKNLLFTTFYGAYITGQKMFTYFKGLIIPFAATIIVTAISRLFELLLRPNNWGALILCGLIVFALYMVITYLFLINREERKKINSIAAKRIVVLKV